MKMMMTMTSGRAFALVLIGLWFVGDEVRAQDVRMLPVAEYEERVYASWLGQIIGNIYGLPHENQHIDKPGADRFPYGYEIQNPDPDDFEHGYGSRLPHVRRVNGAFSDDDTDIEYMYLLAMEKYGPEPTYAQLASSWMHHVRERVWLANRAALGAMHFGYQPPVTGMRDYNPHWFQIDPQLVNEIWAVTSPGMVDYAVQKSKWAARITNDDWGVEPTMFYGAMYAAAFFESDARRLIDIAIEAMPDGSYFVETVQEMKRLRERYPDDWQPAWYEMARRYYLEDEPDTRTIWNANLNGAAGILSLLYGDNDFQRTLDLACALGFDADNQAATMAGLMGLALGLEGIPDELLYPVEGWTEPFNDFYKNESRHDMPDASLKDMARRMAKQGEQILLKQGGRIVEQDGVAYYEINARAEFTPPLELPRGPMPYLEVGRPADEELFVSGSDAPVHWEVISGALPEGLALNDGRLTGTPVAPGVHRVGIRVRQEGRTAERNFQFVVRPPNLAAEAAEVLASVDRTDTAVRDSMWLTVGASLYADDVSVIRDGRTLGNGSTFYSIDGSSQPREDFYGYVWDEPQTVGLLGFHTGSMEENGGWFTSLNVEYRDASGDWQRVEDLTITPGLIPGNRPYTKPHFVEYLLAFEPVTTTAVRIIGDAGGGDHWYSDPAYFTSITELTVHGALPDRHQLTARTLPQNWWESAAAMVRVHLRDWGNNPVFSLEPEKAAAQLDALRANGFTVLEVFAPFEGGPSFHGLDAVDRYSIHSTAGTIDDFRRVVRLAHDRDMPVIAFDNLGYSAIEAVDFLKAADDVRAGRTSRETKFYYWSDSADAPPPGSAPGDTYFMVRPTHLPGGAPGTFYESQKHEYWAYSERAGKYYWSKWAGSDSKGQSVRLPQYNWGTPEFQDEAERVVRFWMDTGIDGMIIDAVNWYIDYTWEIGRERMTDVMAEYGNAYMQPEGAGGFHEDPVPWVTEGGWNSVQDYGLGIWWEDGTNVVANAIESGDPRPIERALRDYHDRVIAAGAVNYFEPPEFDEPEKERLSIATLAFIGDLIYVSHERALRADDEVRWILETKAAHPALHNLSTRRAMPTDADDRHYAFLQTAADGSERILVVLNFQPTSGTATVDLSGLAASELMDVRTGDRFKRDTRLSVELPPFGYRLFLVQI